MAWRKFSQHRPLAKASLPPHGTPVRERAPRLSRGGRFYGRDLWRNTRRRHGQPPDINVLLVPDTSPGAFPNSITAGPDGNLWFTEGKAVERITPAGMLMQFPLDESVLPLEIAAAPGGICGSQVMAASERRRLKEL